MADCQCMGAGPPPGMAAAAGAKKAPVISGATTVVKMPRAQVATATCPFTALGCSCLAA